MALPAVDYQKSRIEVPEELYKGLDSLAHGLIGRWRRRSRILEDFTVQAARVKEAAAAFRQAPARKLREAVEECRPYFRKKAAVPGEVLVRALAVVEEYSYRNLAIRPHAVQTVGALALYGGYLAEMATGEGKSLTAALAGVLFGWSGRPCHIVTVNDYLANRDAVELRDFYHDCGVTVGCVLGAMEPALRRENYQKAVVYTTSKELLADFLRDRILMGRHAHATRRALAVLAGEGRRFSQLVMRGIHTAIVDEADSVLIDEAVTPLIISRPRENKALVAACTAACRIAARLEAGGDYRVDLKYKEVELTDKGRERIEELVKDLPGFWRAYGRRSELIEQALTAREFYKRGKQYVVRDGKVVIVDEFTGRLMENRTWSQGLHQAVEAKEGVELTPPSETLARLSFQRFFRFFTRLSGMTGTAREACGEFWDIYELPVVAIPTNRPCLRVMEEDLVFAGAEEKFRAIADEVRQVAAIGRPVLVGTRSVEVSERLSGLLREQGIEHALLNAVNHAEEAGIVAGAGEKGRVTIATNMAGRGTDIKLAPGVAELGGLHVIASERHESGRIDRQLFGRCARQGDPGSARAFLSLEDELIRRFVPAFLQRRLTAAVAQGSPHAARIARHAMWFAQQAAQRLAFRQRRSVLKMDTWLDDALSFAGQENI